MNADLSLARAIADALWKQYITETDPMKRAHYGERYAVWAKKRDQLQEGEGYCDL